MHQYMQHGCQVYLLTQISVCASPKFEGGLKSKLAFLPALEGSLLPHHVYQLVPLSHFRQLACLDGCPCLQAEGSTDIAQELYPNNVPTGLAQKLCNASHLCVRHAQPVVQIPHPDDVLSVEQAPQPAPLPRRPAHPRQFCVRRRLLLLLDWHIGGDMLRLQGRRVGGERSSAHNLRVIVVALELVALLLPGGKVCCDDGQAAVKYAQPDCRCPCMQSDATTEPHAFMLKKVSAVHFAT